MQQEYVGIIYPPWYGYGRTKEEEVEDSNRNMVL